MKVKIVFIFCLFAFNINLCFAQKEANNWYFPEKAGITFNSFTGVPVAVTDGKISGNLTAIGTISDKTGNLLFYTDGFYIWNLYHQVMSNGYGLTKDSVKPKSLCIIPHPENTNLYYIFFTVQNKYPDSLNSLQYTIVDMTLDGGFGDVSSKGNILIKSDIFTCITHTRHSNYNDIWIIAGSFLGEFEAFLFTKSGIIKPVKSNMDFIRKYYLNKYSSGANCLIKASPDGNRIAGYPSGNSFRLFYFDNNSGVVSKPITIFPKYWNIFYRKIINFAFSSDCSKLYLSTRYNHMEVYTLDIIQIDLTAGSIVDIARSPVELFEEVHEEAHLGIVDTTQSDLELANNEKIYISKAYKPALACINSPNIRGFSCNYVDSALYLEGKISLQKLPHFLHNFKYLFHISSNSPICNGKTLFLKTILDSSIKDASFEWSYPNGTKSNAQNPVITNVIDSTEGVYRLKAKVSGNGFKDSVIMKELYVSVNPMPVIKIENELPVEICRGDSTTLRVANPDSTYTYVWSTGDSTTEITVKKPNYYKVKATTFCGCVDSVTVPVSTLSPPYVKIIPKGSTTICFGDSVTLKAMPSDTNFQYLWSTGETSREITVKEKGTYRLKVTDANGCRDSSTIKIDYYNTVTAVIRPRGNVIACKGDTVFLHGNPRGSACSYKWSTGETASDIRISKDGTYWVTVSNISGCHGSDTVNVAFKEMLETTIAAEGATTFCEGDSTTLYIEPYFSEYKYRWSNDSTDSCITVKKSGTYKVYVESPVGCRDSSSIDITVHPKPELIITGVKTLCEGDSTILATSQPFKSYLWSTGETTSSIIVKDSGTYSLKVESEFCASADSATITISNYPKPQVKIFGNRLFCEGDSIKLSCDGDFVSYKWQNSETAKEIWVKDAGKYSVEVVDANGCRAKDSLVVEKIVVSCRLSVTGSMDFGRIAADSTSDSAMIVTNTSKDAVTVSARLSIGDGFSLETEPQSPANIDRDSIFTIKVKFLPKEARGYSDSLIIEITEPCYKRYAIYLSGSGYRDTIPLLSALVWLPDTAGNVGNRNFRIPLKVVGRNESQINNISYSAVIRYNASYFQADSVTTGILAGKNMVNQDEILKIEGDSINISRDTSIITQICGTLLLGDTLRIPLLIDSISIIYPKQIVEKKNGSLKIEDYCMPGFSKIKFITPPEIQLYPNPSGSSITITAKLGNSTDMNISIYNSIGDKRMEFTEKAGAGQYQKEINLESLASGFYYVNIIINGENWCWSVVKE
jgi:hypothetical protein